MASLELGSAQTRADAFRYADGLERTHNRVMQWTLAVHAAGGRGTIPP